jgi:hypothetical protein
MIRQNHTKKIAFALSLLMIVQVALAVSGSTDEKSKRAKYSLKSLNKYSSNLSLSAVKTRLQYKGGLNALGLNTTKLSLQNADALVYSSGNTTYVFPYKAKIKVPKFKTPTPANQ